MTLRTGAPAVAAVALAAVVITGSASPSQLLDRNAGAVTLQVSSSGQALLTYRAGGRLRRVLAWGAINAVPPTQAKRQAAFRLDYSGGVGTRRRHVWKAFRNTCGPYTGPTLQWLVIACTAGDGSHWALQSWQRTLPNYGVRPTAKQSSWELRLSHWSGPLPELEVKTNWAYRRYDHLYGRFTYRGGPVHGSRSTPTGVPLDTFGRNLYVDTFDSAYGRGWKRENGFLMHKGSGAFCYGFFPHGGRPHGEGVKYRATIVGPGVTPDMVWTGEAPGPYDRARDEAANAEISALGTRRCKPN
jgi:hypothetical protein